MCFDVPQKDEQKVKSSDFLDPSSTFITRTVRPVVEVVLPQTYTDRGEAWLAAWSICRVKIKSWTLHGEFSGVVSRLSCHEKSLKCTCGFYFYGRLC